MSRIALGEEKKMYKILDLKAWVDKQRKLNKKTQAEVQRYIGERHEYEAFVYLTFEV